MNHQGHLVKNASHAVLACMNSDFETADSQTVDSQTAESRSNFFGLKNVHVHQRERMTISCCSMGMPALSRKTDRLHPGHLEKRPCVPEDKNRQVHRFQCKKRVF